MEASARGALEPLLERQQRSVAVRESMQVLKKHSAAAFLPSRLLGRASPGSSVEDLEAALEDYRASFTLIPAGRGGEGAVWEDVARKSQSALFQVGLQGQVLLCSASPTPENVCRCLKLLEGVAEELGAGYRAPAEAGEVRFLDPEPGKLLASTVGKASIEAFTTIRNRAAQMCERAHEEGAGPRVQSTVMVRAALAAAWLMVDAVTHLWQLANHPEVIEVASRFPLAGHTPQGRGEGAASPGRLDGTFIEVASSTGGSPGPEPGLPGGLVKRLKAQSSVSAQQLSRMGSSISALLHSDPLDAEKHLAMIIDGFGAAAHEILDHAVSGASVDGGDRGVQSDSRYAGDGQDLMALGSLIRAICAARIRFLGSGGPEGGIFGSTETGRGLGTSTMGSAWFSETINETSMFGSAAVASVGGGLDVGGQVVSVPAEAVDVIDSLLRDLVERTAAIAAAKLTEVAGTALIDNPAVCAVALAERVGGASSAVLMSSLAALDQSFAIAESTPAVVMELEGVATLFERPEGRAGGGEGDRTGMVAWLRSIIRSAICAVEAAARDADASASGLLFDSEPLISAVWETGARVAEFLDLCSTKGGVPDGPNRWLEDQAPGLGEDLSERAALLVGGVEWALGSLRSVAGLEALCQWAEGRLRPLSMHLPELEGAREVGVGKEECLVAIARARESLLRHFTGVASGQICHGVRTWVSSVARRGEDALSWSLPGPVRSVALEVMEVLCLLCSDLMLNVPSEKEAVLGRAAESLFRQLGDSIEGASGGNGEGEGAVLSACAYCQLRLEVEVVDFVTAPLQRGTCEGDLNRALAALGDMTRVTEEDIALLGIARGDGGKLSPSVLEGIYTSATEDLLPAEMERTALLAESLEG